MTDYKIVWIFIWHFFEVLPFHHKILKSLNLEQFFHDPDIFRTFGLKLTRVVTSPYKQFEKEQFKVG